MDKQALLDQFNARTPGFIGLLGGSIVDLDPQGGTCEFEFNVSTDFCHSVNVVQGGFTTAMLDAAMSHAIFAQAAGEVVGVSSLEIKTSYLAPTLAGKLNAVGRVRKAAYKTAFLEAELYNEAGDLTATASSVAKLVRKKD